MEPDLRAGCWTSEIEKTLQPAWEPLDQASPLAGPALAETLDGGQCFRWRPEPDGIWSGVSGKLALRLRSTAAGLQSHILAGARADAAHHLACDTDWHELADSLPWRSDSHLANCMAAFPGLRILRQPIAEALLCFLCSATKQIVQIKQMTALLAERFGRKIAPGIHALPTWDALARISEADLRGCLLGFRAKNIRAVAEFLSKQTTWLADAEAAPYDRAKAMLIELPGVGPKIADCVLLFGAGKLEAFPVDVWILRVMERRYGLQGWSPQQIAHFGRTHFGPLAGLAQQYIFAWERQAARTTTVPVLDDGANVTGSRVPPRKPCR